jgi:hypothetical protein
MYKTKMLEANSTTHTLLQELFINQDIEMINLCQQAISLLCTVVILLKLFDVGSFFSSVQKKRLEMKKERERKEYEKLKKMFNSIQNHEELKLSDSDDGDANDGDAGVMKIARKKKKTLPESSV